MDPRRAAGALLGRGSTVIHAARQNEPTPSPRVRAVVLREDEYLRLAAFVRGSFATNVDQLKPPQHGYGQHDAFYSATGGYSAWRTCNEWTGRALRAAGVRMGAWTPLPFGVMQWL